LLDVLAGLQGLTRPKLRLGQHNELGASIAINA
jgi:hypothetical protein